MLTPEQIEARKTGLGGSDIAALVGLSKWMTPLELFLTKIGEREDNQTSEFAKWGNYHEDNIRQEYMAITGKMVGTSNELFRHPVHHWMIANVDGIIEGEKALLECKSTSFMNRRRWGTAGTDEIPEEYLLQCAHYAIVLDVEYVDIAVLIGGNDFRIYTYKRNAVLENRLIELESDFWNNHVVPRSPPRPRTIGDASILWPESKEKSTKVMDESLEAKILRLPEVRNALKELEEEENQIKGDICAFLQDSEVLMDYSGKRLASWQTQYTNRFDTQVFKEKEPVLYAQYLKETATRVFRLHHD